MRSTTVETPADSQAEDSYSVTRILDGHTYRLNLTDTAGQEEYRALFSTSNLQTADAFLFVYDITNPESLYALKHHLQLVGVEEEQRLDRNGIPPVKVIVGNKCDLNHERKVQAQEGVKFAREHRGLFMETSARDMVNVEETFASRLSFLSMLCTTTYSLPVMVKRVMQMRRNKAQLVAEAHNAKHGGNHSAGQTKPLTPLEEKDDPYGNPRSKEAARSNSGSSKKSAFFAKLKCW